MRRIDASPNSSLLALGRSIKQLARIDRIAHALTHNRPLLRETHLVRPAGKPIDRFADAVHFLPQLFEDAVRFVWVRLVDAMSRQA
jgi:hypothetical protein